MKRSISVFLFVAVGGFVASTLIHSYTYLGGIDLSIALPFIPCLFGPLALAWLAMIFFGGVATGERSKRFSWTTVTDSAPRWMRILCVAIMAYGFINFFYSIGLSDGAGPSIIDSRYVLEYRGKIIREISQADYLRYGSYQVRAVTGFFMLFYAIAVTVLYSTMQKYKDQS